MFPTHPGARFTFSYSCFVTVTINIYTFLLGDAQARRYRVANKFQNDSAAIIMIHICMHVGQRPYTAKMCYESD